MMKMIEDQRLTQLRVPLAVIRQPILQQMEQQKKPGLRAKLSSYFRMLCGRPLEVPRPESEDLERRPTVKRKRLTFVLDRALVKLSRRNIAGEEFSAKQQVQEEVERHLAQRLTGVALAVFEGPFGETATAAVCFPISLLPSPPPPRDYITPNNEIVTNLPFPLRRSPQGVEAYVQWVGAGQAAVAIESTLLRFHSLAEHFVFACEGEVRLADLHGLFVLYREDYMFELERVMLLDRCVRHLVYVSRSEQFLHIDRGSLIEFCVEELARRDGSVGRAEFAWLLDRLFEAGLYVEVASVLGDLVVTADEVLEFDKQFAKTMQERYSYSHAIVRRASEATTRTTPPLHAATVPKFHENTPLFGVAEHNSIKGNLSETGSVVTRHQLAVSFGRAISRRMGDWQA